MYISMQCQLIIVFVSKVCFTCEIEAPEREAQVLGNLNSCPWCHAIFKTPPKLLTHITTHVLYDNSINREDEPCGLCLSPSPLYWIALKKNKDSFNIDYANSTCPRLSKFSYTAASQPSPSNPSTNVPVKCPCCPKGANSVWKYNMVTHYTKKHLPWQPPPEFHISDFELEGLKMVWNNWHTTNWLETRRKRNTKMKWDISEAHSSRLSLWYVSYHIIDQSHT